MTSDHPPPQGWVCSCDCLPSVSGCTLRRGPEPILDHLSLSEDWLYNDNCQAAAAMGVARSQMGL